MKCFSALQNFLMSCIQNEEREPLFAWWKVCFLVLNSLQNWPKSKQKWKQNPLFARGKVVSWFLTHTFAMKTFSHLEANGYHLLFTLGRNCYHSKYGGKKLRYLFDNNHQRQMRNGQKTRAGSKLWAKPWELSNFMKMLPTHQLWFTTIDFYA